MRHVTLTLSDDLAAFATEAAAEQGYPTLDAYLDALLREAREVGSFRALIDEGARSPTPADGLDAAFFQDLRTRIAAKK